MVDVCMGRGGVSMSSSRKAVMNKSGSVGGINGEYRRWWWIHPGQEGDINVRAALVDFDNGRYCSLINGWLFPVSGFPQKLTQCWLLIVTPTIVDDQQDRSLIITVGANAMNSFQSAPRQDITMPANNVRGWKWWRWRWCRAAMACVSPLLGLAPVPPLGQLLLVILLVVDFYQPQPYHMCLRSYFYCTNYQVPRKDDNIYDIYPCRW